MVAQGMDGPGGKDPHVASARARGACARRTLLRNVIARLLVLFKGDDLNIEAPPFVDESKRDGSPEEALPPGLLGTPDDEHSDVVRSREVKDGRDGILGAQVDDLGTELAGLLRVGQERALDLGVDPLGGLGGGLHVEHEPARVESPRQPRAAPEQGRGLGWIGGHADAHPLPRAGAKGSGLGPAGEAELDGFGHLAQRELTQGLEVLFLEEVRERPFDLLGRVILPARSRSRRSSAGMSRLITWSACRRKLSGTVSRTRTSVTLSTRSFRLSRCWMLNAARTLMPASRISSTSWYRFRFLLPGALVWATSSTIATSGARASHRLEIELLDGHASIVDRLRPGGSRAPRSARPSRSSVGFD